MLRYISFIIIIAAIAGMASCQGCKGKVDVPVDEVVTDTVEMVNSPQIDSLSLLIAKDTGNPVLYYYRSSEFAKKQAFTLAERDLAKAIQLVPTEAKFHLALSDLYFAQKDIVRAINALEQGKTQVPESIELLITLARYYYYKNDFPKAQILISDVLRLDASNADAYFLRGQVYKESGDTSKAISSLQTTIEMDPQYYDAYMLLGVLNANKKNPNALSYYANALRLDSTSIEARYGIAKYHQDKEEYKLAIEMYRQMIVDTPQYEKPYYNLGYIYLQLDSLDKADRNLEIASSVKPEYADAYYMRGLIAELKGALAIKKGKESEAQDNFKQAEYFYDQTLRIDPENGKAIDGFGRLRNMKKK